MRCEYAAGGEGDEAAAPLAAKLGKNAAMTYKNLRGKLRQRGLDSTGNKRVLVARLEEDRKKDAGCRWRGCVGQLAAHLRECEWAPVNCLNEGCKEMKLRRDAAALAEHEAVCEHRLVQCRHFKHEVAYRSLAEHEGRCSRAQIECPNEGCSVQYKRFAMNLHRLVCEHEEVMCLCPGCHAFLLRKGMDAHVEATHLGLAVKLLQSAWSQNAALEGKFEAAKSEQRLAAPRQRFGWSFNDPASWVFNWRADGWGEGVFRSETHDFDFWHGTALGSCALSTGHPQITEDSHFIGITVSPRRGAQKGRLQISLHVTFSILDKHDQILREVHEIGTATALFWPESRSDGYFTGSTFTPTAEEKRQSVRADGSIRLRAVVRLFWD